MKQEPLRSSGEGPGTPFERSILNALNVEELDFRSTRHRCRVDSERDLEKRRIVDAPPRTMRDEPGQLGISWDATAQYWLDVTSWSGILPALNSQNATQDLTGLTPADS